MKLPKKRLLSWLGAVLLVGVAPFHSLARGVSPQAAKSQTSSPKKKASSKPAAKKRSAKSTTRRRRSRRRPRAQKAPTPDRIREIQAALARVGTYQGEPTGKWDARSVAAMKAFQAANGFNPTGKIGALSLQKLGLGSEVAGVAKPRPVDSTDDRTSPPKR